MKKALWKDTQIRVGDIYLDLQKTGEKRIKHKELKSSCVSLLS